MSDWEFAMFSAGHCGMDAMPDGLGGCSGDMDCRCSCTACQRRVVSALRAEVARLGAMLDDVQREVEPEQWMRDVGGDQ